MDPRLKAFERLLNIMDDLRKGCPWDMKQTLESLRYLTIEETYELSDAILKGDIQGVKEEVGDIMLHLIFYAKIGSEKGAFDITDVLNGISEKLIFRHPHIYGDVTVVDAEEVKRNWEKLKLKEGKKSVLGGVPDSMAPLIKAIRIQEKVKGVGFDWEKPEQVWEKVEEEIGELQHEVKSGKSQDKIEGEFGDLLFSLVNYGRFIGVNPDEAIEKTNRKFIKRFQYLEQASAKAGKTIDEMSLSEMDVYWEEAKKFE
ncbi:MAG: nucleoside triphosphate pyrophosphohydrolase [Bacteroidetes bacterium]|nr:MAG: nucleoside triphosphate pyrophosphohydrolase [Bacteroidota bacterium]